MELENILSVVEPSNRNVIWLHPIDGKIIQKIYGSKGWEVINNGGNGEDSIPEATPDTLGGVKLGTSHIEDSLPIRYIRNNSINGLGITLGTYRSKINPVIPLMLGTKIGSVANQWTTTYDSFTLGVPIDTAYFKLTEQGLSLTDKPKDSTIKITWNDSSNMNDFKTSGIYDIYGERTNLSDNLPILNSNPGHSIAARLTVVASTLQPANNEICVTQFLMLSNRRGGDGNMYVRTYNQNNSPFMNGWSPWQKQIGMVETLINGDDVTVGQEIFSQGSGDKIGNGINGMIDNGMYSGIYIDNLSYTGTSKTYYLSAQPTFVETFVLIVINDYAASGQLGLTRHITQLKYAVDAITGQSTVKKRVGTGSDSISWGDWEEIGSGGRSSEVDVTDALMNYSLLTLRQQGYVKQNTVYRVKITSESAIPYLDTNNKIVEHILASKNETDPNFYELYIRYYEYAGPSIFIIDAETSWGKTFKFTITDLGQSTENVKVSADMTTL